MPVHPETTTAPDHSEAATGFEITSNRVAHSVPAATGVVAQPGGSVRRMDELGRVIRRLQAEIDGLEARVHDLERGPVVRISMSEGIAQRQRLVARMRAEGLSIERISRALAIPRTTVNRDIKRGQIPPATRVTETANGRPWSRRNGATAA